MKGYLFAQNFQNLINNARIIFLAVASLFLSISQAYSQPPIVVVEDVVLRVANPEELSVQMKLYPNPARDNAIIEVEGAEQIQELGVFDLSGRHIHTYRPQFLSSSYKLSVTELPSGTYIIRVRTENGLVSKKLSVANG